MGAVALVTVLVAVLVVTHWAWATHVAAWHFQLTRETKTLDPVPKAMEYSYDLTEHFLQQAANDLGSSVIFDPTEVPPLEIDAFRRVETAICNNSLPLAASPPQRRFPEQVVTALLYTCGWRALKQRFPRKAFVLIRDRLALQRESH